jgi:hypothetical protein
MAVKQTIAIVEATTPTGVSIANALANSSYRLLLIGNEEDQLLKLQYSIRRKGKNTEVDIVSCMRDGCWEADVIILTNPSQEQNQVAEKIREVATQKKVILVSETPGAADTWQELLPHSKIIQAASSVEPSTGNTELQKWVGLIEEEQFS